LLPLLVVGSCRSAFRYPLNVARDVGTRSPIQDDCDINDSFFDPESPHQNLPFRMESSESCRNARVVSDSFPMCLVFARRMLGLGDFQVRSWRDSPPPTLQTRHHRHALY